MKTLITFRCPSCDAGMLAEAGAKLSCADCGQRVQAPSPTLPSPPRKQRRRRRRRRRTDAAPSSSWQAVSLLIRCVLIAKMMVLAAIVFVVLVKLALIALFMLPRR